jgi:hypothetical protein
MKTVFFALMLAFAPFSAWAATTGPAQNNAVFWIDRDAPNGNYPAQYQSWVQTFDANFIGASLKNVTLFVSPSNPDGATFLSVSLYMWDVTERTVVGASLASATRLLSDATPPRDLVSGWGNPELFFPIAAALTPNATYALALDGDGAVGVEITTAFGNGGLFEAASLASGSPPSLLDTHSPFGDISVRAEFNVATVPLPASMLLLIFGVATLPVLRRFLPVDAVQA